MALPKFDPQRDQPERKSTITPPLAEVATRVAAGERVLLHEDGAPIAAVISLMDLRRLEMDDRRRNEAIEAARAFSRHFADLDPDEVEREAVAAVREVRAEMWAERQRRTEG